MSSPNLIQPRGRALRRDLSYITADGALFSLMVGVGETYVGAFALAIGLGDVVAGLVVAVPVVAGAVLQLVSPFAVRWLDSYRRWVILCAAIQATTFLPLIGAALLGTLPAPLLFLVVSLYWAAGMGTGPAWNTWVGTLVPPRLRARYFARRGRLVQLALLAGILAGGSILHAADARSRLLLGFATVFLLAGGLRVLSATCLFRQSEAPGLPRMLASAATPGAAGSALDLGHRKLLGYLLAVQAAVHIVAPFFTPYMIGPLGLSYAGYMTLIAAAFVAKALAFPALGEFARRLGAQRLLTIGGVGIVPLSALWTVSDNYLYLLLVQVAAGVFWAAYELASMLLFFETIRAEQRTAVLTLFNLGNATAMVGGALVGAALLTALGSSREGYTLLLLISAAARLGTLPLLRWIPSLNGGAVLPVLRPLAARPSAGSMDRPVIASLLNGDREPPAESS